MTVSHLELAARSTVAMACRACLGHAVAHLQITGTKWDGSLSTAAGADDSHMQRSPMPQLSMGAMGLAARSVATVLLVAGASDVVVAPLKAALGTEAGEHIKEWLRTALHQCLPPEAVRLHAEVDGVFVL